MAMKQMETTNVKISGIDFYIKPFPAFKAANLTGELASVLTPLLSAFAPLLNENDDESDNENRSLMDVDVSKAAEAMSNCSAINGDKLEILMKKLLLGGHISVEVPDENGDVEVTKLDMDIANEVFCGEVQDMFILCFYVMKLNFKGFFKKLVNLSGKVELAKVKTPRVIV